VFLALGGHGGRALERLNRALKLITLHALGVLSLAFGLSLSLAFGLSLSLAFGLSLSLAFGLSLSLAFGGVLSLAFGGFLSLAFGGVFSLAFGLSLSLALGLRRHGAEPFKLLTLGALGGLGGLTLLTLGLRRHGAEPFKLLTLLTLGGLGGLAFGGLTLLTLNPITLHALDSLALLALGGLTLLTLDGLALLALLARLALIVLKLITLLLPGVPIPKNLIVVPLPVVVRNLVLNRELKLLTGSVSAWLRKVNYCLAPVALKPINALGELTLLALMLITLLALPRLAFPALKLITVNVPLAEHALELLALLARLLKPITLLLPGVPIPKNLIVVPLPVVVRNLVLNRELKLLTGSVSVWLRKYYCLAPVALKPLNALDELKLLALIPITLLALGLKREIVDHGITGREGFGLAYRRKSQSNSEEPCPEKCGGGVPKFLRPNVHEQTVGSEPARSLEPNWEKPVNFELRVC